MTYALTPEQRLAIARGALAEVGLGHLEVWWDDDEDSIVVTGAQPHELDPLGIGRCSNRMIWKCFELAHPETSCTFDEWCGATWETKPDDRGIGTRAVIGKDAV